MKRLPWILCAALAFTAVTAVRAEDEARNEKSASTLRLSKFVLPEFPEYLRQAGITQGSVTIAIGRDNEGHVNDVLVLESSNARFSHAVENAVKQWRFQYPVDPQLNSVVPATIPVVRVVFTAKGVSVVQALTGSLANPDAIGKPEQPVQLPSESDLDSPLKPVSQPMPHMTAAQRSRMGDGLVTVKYFVDTDGRVRVPVVMEASAPELGEATSAALAKWQFQPPTVSGRPTIAINTQTFQFAPKNGM